jgi:hypothetical protein
MPLHNNLQGDEPAADATEVLRTFQQIVAKNPDKFAKLMSGDADDPKRPKNWSRLANAPYYKHRFALDMKVIYDQMMADMTDREFKFKEFPDISRQTLYLRVNQSRRYLVDKLDPTGIYTAFNECVTVTREETGIRINIHRDVQLGAEKKVGFMPDKVVARELQWRGKMDEWMEGSQPDDRFEQKELSLSDEQVQELRLELDQLEGIAASVTNSSVKILRL